MFKNVLNKLVGDANQRELKRLEPLVEEINSLEPELEALSDEKLRLKTREFKKRLQAGHSLDDLMVEAFAAVREAAKRTVYMRHFDVQLTGGIVLHQGKVAEMKTGEGKTLVATLPLYLNALQGKGAHLVTVNDYLARRDTQWMGPVYNFLGLSVGLLQKGGKAFLYDTSYEKGDFEHLRPIGRKEAYLADITYGTNNEFGFDYLRDNMATELSQRVQRGLHYAIIDEADYILIDEARTPLIISGPSHEPLEEYRRFADVAKKLQPGIDYEVDLKDQIVTLTDQGLAKVEQKLDLLNIYGEQNYKYVHYLEQALKARVLYKRDRDYIRQGQNIILIDEFTGRLMPHRRLSEGLHQAIEAKEGVRIKSRTMTYATITLQNFFRLYEKLAGMTGTAATAAEELYQIYGLDVVIIPTNEPMIRIDHPDVVYRIEEAKWKAIVREIEESHKAGRPVLVGTTSVEKSERLSRKLREKDIPHQVLNAKNHAKEAAIIAKAGEPGAVTVATKMAGRGVDIKLGGELSQETIKKAHDVLRRRGINPFKASEAQRESAVAEVAPQYSLRREKVLELGGLHILGTERHEARRIDNQLRGRSGRQGDPGSSRFYLSLEDDLMRRFGGPNVANLMQRLGVEDDIPIEHNLVSRAIESAQNRVEGYNFDIRKHLLEYDDVLNSQRQTIYDQRYKILTKEDLSLDLWEMVQEEIEEQISQADSLWKLIDYLDRIVPLAFPPPDSPIRYPLLFANLTCLPPFSINFLAEKLEGLTPEALGLRLMEVSQEAFEEYRWHLLDRTVEERAKWAEKHYEEDLAAYTTRLERLIEDFLLTHERQSSKPWHNLLQGLQKSFPLRLDVSSAELNGLGADEVRGELLAALEESYHRSLCEALIKIVEGRTPAALELADLKPLDLPRQDLTELFEWAKKEVRDEEAKAQLAKIEKVVRGGEYRDSLIKLLLDLNSVTFFDIEALGEVLRRTLAQAYNAWAQRQLKEIKASIRSGVGELEQPSITEIAQLLLDVYHTERTFFDKDHKRRMSPTSRLHLGFLAAASARDREPEQLRREVLTHLKALLKARESLWGKEALRTMSQQRLSDLGSKMYNGFAKLLGAELVKGEERIDDLNEDVQESIYQYLEIRRLEQRTLAELDPQLREGITGYLDQRLADDMGRRPIALDEETRAEVKRYLLDEGYFDDETRQRDLFRQKVNELDARIYEEIAQHWGHKLLMEMEEKPIAELDETTRQLILRCLRERGHFVDEEKLQHFLTHQRLSDLGEETCRAVVQHLNQKRLKALRDKRIENLPLDVRRGTMGYLNEMGCFTDEDKRQEFAQRKVGDLEEATYSGLVCYFGHQQLDKGQRIADLKANLRTGLRRHLRKRGFLTDEEKVAAFPDMHLSDLGGILEKAQRALLQEVKDKLDRHPIGQLDEELGESIIGYLKEIGYFTDEDKRRLFQQQPLAALAPDILHGLERHLGHRVMTEIEEKKFFNLEQETRQNVLKYFDEKGFLKRKSERRRFIQQRTLSDLEGEVYDGLAYYLGRHVLTKIKGLRVAQLPDEMGQVIWSYLKSKGYFTDGELVALVRESKMADLEPRVQKTILSHLAQGIEEGFAEGNVADLKGYIRRGLRRYLEETDYFVDEDKLSRIKRAKVTTLDGEIREVVARYLGHCLLGKFNEQRIADLEREVQESIWCYLDEVDYFLDEASKESYVQQRLSDLDLGTYSGLAEHLAYRLEEEIKGKKVADLDGDSRQAIRAYLLSKTDRFVKEAEVEEFEQRPLADLREEDRQAVALSLGRRYLEEIGNRRLVELDEEVRESTKHHLREQGYFFDQAKWQRFQRQRLFDLDDEIRMGLLEHLRSKQAKALEGHRIADLRDEMRQRIRDYLCQEDSRLEGEFESQRLTDLEPELHDDLLRHLGCWQLEGSEGKKIADLDGRLHRALQRYFGHRMMHKVQKQVMLGAIDRLWVEYLTDIEDLRQGIGLEAFGQRDPLVEYKRKAYDMFQDLLVDIRRMVVGNIYRASPQLLKLAGA